MTPVVSGALDLAYLRDALARAGERASPTDLATEPLTDGRQAARVTRLRVRADDGTARDWVLKVVPPAEWRGALGTDGVEARLWLSGTTRALPAELRCPNVDVARHPAADEWWILMEDVSHGIVPRGGFDETKAAALMRTVARMHAQHWGRDQALEALPLPRFDQSATAFARLCAHVARGDAAPEPWLPQLSQDFWVPRALLPTLLDAIPSADADFYIQLCSDHPRIARALDEHPRTLLHGDLRRANISFVGGDVVLFDWELASSGPGARDLAWYWFLQFWAYPPADGRSIEDRDALLAVYLDALERERGQKLDRASFDASCDLAWLSVLCQIGCCLADPLTDASPSPDTVARTKHVIARAFERARRIQDRHVR